MSSLRKTLILSCLLLSGPLAGCEEPPPDDRPAAREELPGTPASQRTAEEMADEQKLMLIDRLPLGSSHRDVQEVFPNVSDLKPEGGSGILGEQGLYEALAEATILEQPGDIEFNFENNELYSYYYALRDIECSTASDLYAQLQQFYSLRFGQYAEEQQAEGSYRTESSYWRRRRASIVLTNTFYGDACTLSWGFQNQQP